MLHSIHDYESIKDWERRKRRKHRERERERNNIADTLHVSVLCDGAYVLGTAIGVTLHIPRPCNSAGRHARRTLGCLIDCLHILCAPVPRTQTTFCMNVRSVRVGSLSVFALWYWRQAKLVVEERDHRPRHHIEILTGHCDERETARDWDEMGLRENNVKIAISRVNSVKN